MRQLPKLQCGCIPGEKNCPRAQSLMDEIHDKLEDVMTSPRESIGKAREGYDKAKIELGMHLWVNSDEPLKILREMRESH